MVTINKILAIGLGGIILLTACKGDKEDNPESTAKAQSFIGDTIPLGEKYIEGLASFDIDHEGKDELIVLTNYYGINQNGQLLIYEWNKSEFELLWKSQETHSYPYGIQTADIKNDSFRIY